MNTAGVTAAAPHYGGGGAGGGGDAPATFDSSGNAGSGGNAGSLVSEDYVVPTQHYDKDIYLVVTQVGVGGSGGSGSFNGGNGAGGVVQYSDALASAETRSPVVIKLSLIHI